MQHRWVSAQAIPQDQPAASEILAGTPCDNNRPAVGNTQGLELFPGAYTWFGRQAIGIVSFKTRSSE